MRHMLEVYVASQFRQQYRQLLGQVLQDGAQEGLRGFLGAEQHQVDVLVSPKQQAFGQNSNPHDPLQGSGWFQDTNVCSINEKT